MIKIRWGLGGLFVLWVIAMALWAAVGLARSARGDVMAARPSPAVTSPRRVLAPLSNPVRGPLTVSLALTSGRDNIESRPPGGPPREFIGSCSARRGPPSAGGW